VATSQPIPLGTRCVLCAVAGLDVMAVAWMLRMGDWLAGFLLAVLAPATHGFVYASRLQRNVLRAGVGGAARRTALRRRRGGGGGRGDGGAVRRQSDPDRRVPTS